MKKGNVMQFLQKLGQSLMMPLAVIPAAGLLMRFGNADVLNIPLLVNAGSAIISNMGMLFAIAVAVGFAEEAGVAGLAGGTGYFVTVAVAKGFDSSIDIGVFGGIVVGIFSGLLYNKFHTFKLPEILAFFGGKRFVPIVTSLICTILGCFFGLTWPVIQNGLNNFGEWLVTLGGIGPTIFMIINRALLPFGLHHIPNNFVFFQLGSYGSVTGEISRFYAGDPTAGSFLVGFFPVMMFGYPAAALAIAHTAKPEKRKDIMTLMFSCALTSFLTGITEPIEFAFTFAAPVLYIANVALSATSAFVCNLLGMTGGFTFSAGLVDYILGFGLSQKPLLVLAVGTVCAVIFYIVFRLLIEKLNLPTPGREEK